MAYDSVFRPDLFRGKVALVTGGGTGIGRCIAHELASLGATVVIAARRTKPLEQTCREITDAGGKAAWHTVNIRDWDSVQALFAWVYAQHGHVHYVVNNAGGQFLAPAHRVSSRGFATVVELNVLGTWNMCRAALDCWRAEEEEEEQQQQQQQERVVVNVIADVRNGFPGMVHTGAARAAVENMTKTLCREWAKFGVRINAVAPGLVVSSGMQNYPPPVQQLVTAEFHSQNPSGRFATESEVSSAVVWLLTPGGAYVNGATVCVDGGSRLSQGGEDALFPRHPTTRAYVGYPTTELRDQGIPAAFRPLLDAYEGKQPSANEKAKL
ncbi:hypothetical protein RI367_003392 [Sorochytrium milnesiophthora]